MAENLGSGEIKVSVDDGRALADLKRLSAEFDKTMAGMDRQKATAHVDLSLAQLEDQIRNAKRQIKQLQAEKATVTIWANKKQLDKEVAEVRKSVAQLEGKKATIEIDAKGAEKTLAQLEATRAAAERLQKQQARAAAQKDKDARIAARNAERESQNLVKLARQYDELPVKIAKMRAEYGKLAVSVENLQKRRKKTTSNLRENSIDLDITAAQAKMALLKSELEALGHPAPSITIKVNKGALLGAALRRKITGEAKEAGDQAGAGFVSSFKSHFTRQSMGNAVQAFGQRIKAGLTGLTEARFNFGPLSGSLRTMILIAGTLGPALLSVAGALGALVGVAGSAALGVGALATGFVGGLIPAAIGFIGVIKPMVSQFSAANKAFKAYNDALQKGNTDLAAKKLKEFHNVLGNVDKSTVTAFRNAQTLSSRWKELTAPARVAGFNLIGDAINFASDNMGTFARRTNVGFKAATDGLRGWIKGMGSKEGQNILGKMMDNFNASIPSIIHGLGQIGAYLGRVGAVASEFLPKMFQGFDHWSTSLANGAKNTTRLRAQLTTMVKSAADIGKLFMSAGRFMASFFGAGVKAGQSMVETMTAALDRWTAFNKSAKGRNELEGFFKQSVKGAQDLFAALAPALGAFVQWAALMAPNIAAFLKGAAYIARFAANLTKLVGMTGSLGTLGATLGALWAVGKISAATNAVLGFARALLGLSAAEAAAGGAAKGGGATGIVGTLFGAGGAAKGTAAAEGAAAARVGLLRRAATMAIPAIGSMGAVAGGAATLGLTVLAGAAIYGAVKLGQLALKAMAVKPVVHDLSAALKLSSDATKANADATVAAGEAQHSYAQSTGRVADLKKQLAAAEAHSGKNSSAYKNVLGQLNSALVERQDNEKKVQQAMGAASTAQQAQTQASNKFADANGDLKKALDERKAAQDRIDKAGNGTLGISPQERAAGERDLARANRDVANAEANRTKTAAALANAQQAQAISAVNYQRTLAGLVPAAGAAAQALGRLYTQNQKVSRTVSTKFADPKDAGKVAGAASKVLSSGLSGRAGQKSVMTVLANTSSAEAAIRRLGQVAAAVTAAKRLVKIGVSDSATSKIASIVARVTSMPPGKARIAAEDRATAVIAHIIGRVRGIPNKTARLLAQDLISGKTRAAQSVINSLQGKTVRVGAQVFGAGEVSAIAGAIGALHDKTVRLNVVQNSTKAVRNSRAIGRGPVGAETALVGEGGGPEFVANHKTGSIMKVSQPTFMDLGPNDAVIPTEATYAARGAKLFKGWAKSMGIPGFAGGKPPKPTTRDTVSHKSKLNLSAHGKATQRGVAQHAITKHNWKSGSAKKQLDQVETDKIAESDQEFEINRAVGKLKEPDSLVKKIGTDANGDDLYAVDDDAVSQWAGMLDGIRKMYDDLLFLIAKTSADIQTASTAVATIISTSQSNKTGLSKAMQREKGIMNASRTSKTEKQAATERHKIYSDQYNAENKALNDAYDDRKTLGTEAHDVIQRGETATDSRDEYAADSAAVAGKAADAAVSANPAAGAKGGSTGDGTTPDQQALIDQQTALATTATRAQGIAEATLSAFTSGGDIGAGGGTAFGAVMGSFANAVSGGSSFSSGGTVARSFGSSGSISTGSAAAAAVGGGMAPASGGMAVAPSGGGQTFIINTLTPGDPDTLRAVGSAAASGQSLQGSRSTTRFPSV